MSVFLLTKFQFFPINLTNVQKHPGVAAPETLRNIAVVLSISVKRSISSLGVDYETNTFSLYSFHLRTSTELFFVRGSDSSNILNFLGS